jgi:Tol biopolymer transport system component
MKGLFALVAIQLVLVPAAGAADEDGILFSAARAGRGGIVLVRPDGADLVDLTGNEIAYETDIRSYSWSPDGSRIVFSSHRDGPSSTEIYVMNADGSGQRRLTFHSGHDSIFDVQPVWSPDGHTIAFVQDKNLSDSIWLMDADGSNQRELANVGAIVRRLMWSPNSTRLLYDVNNAPPNRIELLDVRTGTRRSLTPPGRNDFYASWSPDGRSIAVTSNAPPGANHVDIVNAEDGSRHTLSTVPGTDAAWSPNGAQLAFVGTRGFRSTPIGTAFHSALTSTSCVPTAAACTASPVHSTRTSSAGWREGSNRAGGRTARVSSSIQAKESAQAPRPTSSTSMGAVSNASVPCRSRDCSTRRGSRSRRRFPRLRSARIFA